MLFSVKFNIYQYCIQALVKSGNSDTHKSCRDCPKIRTMWIYRKFPKYSDTKKKYVVITLNLNYVALP